MKAATRSFSCTTSREVILTCPNIGILSRMTRTVSTLDPLTKGSRMHWPISMSFGQMKSRPMDISRGTRGISGKLWYFVGGKCAVRVSRIWQNLLSQQTWTTFESMSMFFKSKCQFQCPCYLEINVRFIQNNYYPPALGWSKMQEGQKSPLPGHFPIHFDILDWKVQKNLKKNVVWTLLKSHLCLLLTLWVTGWQILFYDKNHLLKVSL